MKNIIKRGSVIGSLVLNCRNVNKYELYDIYTKKLQRFKDELSYLDKSIDINCYEIDSLNKLISAFTFALFALEHKYKVEKKLL